MNTVKKQKILFLCTGNSARSQMAEALLRHKAGDKYEVFSAGTYPESVDVRATDALSKFGIDTSNLTAKNLSVFDGEAFDYVITLCNKANEECRSYPGVGKQLAWDFPDPKSRPGSNAFSVTLNELNNRLAMFLLVENKSPETKKEADAIDAMNKTHGEGEEQVVDLVPTDFFKTLTDEIRLKSLMLMHYHGELCVCELMEGLNEANQPKVSRNLAVLKKSQIIVDRKHGQWVFYRINPALPLWAKSAIGQTTENNVADIEGEIMRLDKMEGRPDKESFCKQ